MRMSLNLLGFKIFDVSYGKERRSREYLAGMNEGIAIGQGVSRAVVDEITCQSFKTGYDAGFCAGCTHSKAGCGE